MCPVSRTGVPHTLRTIPWRRWERCRRSAPESARGVVLCVLRLNGGCSAGSVRPAASLQRVALCAASAKPQKPYQETSFRRPSGRGLAASRRGSGEGHHALTRDLSSPVRAGTPCTRTSSRPGSIDSSNQVSSWRAPVASASYRPASPWYARTS